MSLPFLLVILETPRYTAAGLFAMAPLVGGARRSILITGASGRAGRILTKAWRRKYALSLVDKCPLNERAGAPFARGDLSSLAFVRSLCTGIDTIVHLAGLPSPLSEWSELRRHNVRSTWAVLRAARDAGCCRVVFASSIWVELDPTQPYSRAKLLGERLGQRYAESSRLSVISLRLGHVLATRDRQLWPGARYLPYGVIEEDMLAAFTLAVEASPTLHSETFTIISANGRPHCDLLDARTRLGYSPRMDAFSLADRQYRTAWGLLKRAKIWVERRL